MKVIRQFIQNYIRSFRDIPFYNEVYKKPFFFSLQFLYLLTFTVLLLNTLFFTVTAAFFLPRLPATIDKVQQRLDALYPQDLRISIEKGRIQTNRAQPVIIDFPEITQNTGYNHFIVIDTKADSMDYTNKKAMILVTGNGVVYPESNNPSPYRFESAEQFDDIVITKNTYDQAANRINMFLDMLPSIAPWLLITASILIPIFGSLIVVIWRMIILVILTGILLPVSSLFGNKYTYKEIYRMGMHGITIPVTFSLLLNIMGLILPLAFASSFLLWMVIVLARLNEKKIKAV